MMLRHLALGCLPYIAMSICFHAQHQRRVKALSERIYEAVIAPDGGLYVSKTGSLLQSTSLRTYRNREVFQTILRAPYDVQGVHDRSDEVSVRFWTKSVIRGAITVLFETHGIAIPQLPGFNWKQWLEEQVRLFHRLCKCAQRNAAGKPSSMTDTEETQPIHGMEARMHDASNERS